MRQILSAAGKSPSRNGRTNIGLTPECGGERRQRGAVATPSAAMHARERLRLGLGQTHEDLGPVFGVRVVVHLRAKALARLEDVSLCDGGVFGAALREKVA